jgi:hypothetical protein
MPDWPWHTNGAGRRIPPPTLDSVTFQFDRGDSAKSVTIGTDIETSAPVQIGDIERRSGLYVLGKQGMGKSGLLIDIAAQDIQNGHGVFFLDPHGEAIETLFQRYTFDRELMVIDPTDNSHSFGINILACSDINNPEDRRYTFGRAQDVFKKIFEMDTGYRPWLEMIIQNTLFAFIENQGFTLAEVPLFLDPANTDFRNHIVSNIKYNPRVAYFWEREFGRHQKEQQERVDAALTKVSALLSDPDVFHIISQQKTTIDFQDIMENRKVLLVKLPRYMPSDTRKFIGSILLNELIYAVTKRPKKPRHQFCVFVDEVQNFANSDDFATLITEARKYGIATTIAHQDRFGQLADNIKLAGATLTTVNKVMFQLQTRDADELAPEFAKESPKETKRERLFGISQYPFDDLVKAPHKNPKINDFVRKYLRRLHEQLQDARDDMEDLRLQRMTLLDEAALFRLAGQDAGARRLRDHQSAALGMASSAIEGASQLVSQCSPSSLTYGKAR